MLRSMYSANWTVSPAIRLCSGARRTRLARERHDHMLVQHFLFVIISLHLDD